MLGYMICAAKYTKQQENGSLKRVNEKFLVSAESFTDAEALMYKGLGQTVKGEFSINSIAKETINTLLSTLGGDYFFKCKVKVKEDEGKATTHIFYVTADTAKEALKRLGEDLKNYMAETEITSVVQTPVVDLITKESVVLASVDTGIPVTS